MKRSHRERIRSNDRIARWVISAGGITVIASVVLILLLIVREALPLFSPAEVRAERTLVAPLPAAEVRALLTDDYLESAVLVAADGSFTFLRLPDGTVLGRAGDTALSAAHGAVVAAEVVQGRRCQLLWQDGTITLHDVTFRTEYAADNQRRVVPAVTRQGSAPPPPDSIGRQWAQTRLGADGRMTRVDLGNDGRLHITQVATKTNFLGEETRDVSDFILDKNPQGPITALTLDGAGTTLYAGTADGFLLRWSLAETGQAELLDQVDAFVDQRRITTLSLVFGDLSLAVGDAQGGLTTWFAARGADGGQRLHLIHRLAGREGAIDAIVPSQHDKSLLSVGANGHLALKHMTSERDILTVDGGGRIVAVARSGQGDGIVALNEQGQLRLWQIDLGHPEVSWSTLFERVWYESYDEPALVWQSSAATDDFEPKMSLVPLIFGTLKGTFYAMIFAVPLAILGAIYTSQFARGPARDLIKPAVEVMAALPSVVIGFLAALWLAPLVEASLGAVFLSVLLLPAMLLLALLLWQGVRRHRLLRQVERGYEFLAVVPVLLLGFALATVAGPLLEGWFFAGDLKGWLYAEWGMRYDPRNCIIIAFALGFAVIPIIFTIAEDALSNVPNSLKAASLALGASRWQTVWRVMLPSASPGIFAGIMIGFGRAVGETMIVLMATGNTPILDWSIFNGMRSLSANIAVEIPEAPAGGTLFRVLFLSAVILFLITFVVNTVAEIIRQRLRRKYGRF
ncbi:MAG TPA: ABC transporter permease [Desulfuromonas sp.]|nr:ABC transporter permease [Desulfuromonas sp.]HBT84034.1 ABC transporter permease [Desulfuromonas sp.]